MITPGTKLENSFNGASTYQILISGILDIKFAKMIAGMEISHYESESGPVSKLTGRIIDQSELFGILNTLNDYHYSIISVNKINSDS